MNADYSKESYLKYKVCIVCNVPQSEAPGVMYAKFPQNINRCRKWIRVIGNVKLLQLSQKKIQYRYVCGNHFVKSYFTKSGKHLTKDAVPTILPANIRPLKKDVVKLFPPLITRTSNKVLLKCTQRIVPIKQDAAAEAAASQDFTGCQYIKEEYIEPFNEEPRITIKEDGLEPRLKDCLPKVIPILHHNLTPTTQLTEIYTITEDRQVIPITSKVLTDGKDCIIELSHKRIPTVHREQKVIPVSNEVLSSILKKDCNVTVESIKYERNARRKTTQITPKSENQREEQLQMKIRRLQRKNRRLRKILKNVGVVDEITSPNIKKVIEKTILSKQLNVGIKEFTNERRLAISVLKRALNAYHYLSYLMPLPNVCTLQKISMKEPIYSNTTKCKHLL